MALAAIEKMTELSNVEMRPFFVPATLGLAGAIGSYREWFGHDRELSGAIEGQTVKR